jgi:hypothetical protein
MKTGLLEIRPLYHRKATLTRACAFVAMLACAIMHALWEKTSHLNRPLDSILSSLDQIQTQDIKVADQWIPVLPTHFRKDQEIILKTLNIQFPKTVRHRSYV